MYLLEAVCITLKLAKSIGSKMLLINMTNEICRSRDDYSCLRFLPLWLKSLAQSAPITKAHKVRVRRKSHERVLYECALKTDCCILKGPVSADGGAYKQSLRLRKIFSSPTGRLSFTVLRSTRHTKLFLVELVLISHLKSSVTGIWGVDMEKPKAKCR